MAITISGENNNDRILASDGVIDQISGINIVGLITASHINVGSNIQLGNAGIITATTFVGNVTGNVNSTSPLLLQTGGSERIRLTSNNEIGIAGANYGSAGQVLTSGGSGSAVTWSTIPSQITFNNASADRVLTSNGGTSVNAESNLQMTGNILTFNTTANSHRIQNVATGNHYTVFEFDSNRSSAGDELAFIDFQWDGDKVADIMAVAGSDTTNKDDGHLVFRTSPAQGSIAERLRIKSDGKVLIGGTLGLGGATSSPSGLLHAQTSSGEAVVNILGATNGVIQLSGYNGDSTIQFGDASSDAPGKLNYDHGTDSLAIVTNGSERLRISSIGQLLHGDYSEDQGWAVFWRAVAGGADAGTAGQDGAGDKGVNIRSDMGPTHLDLTGTDNFTLKLSNQAYSGAGVADPQGTISKILFNTATHNGWNSYGAIALESVGTSSAKGQLVFLTNNGTNSMAERLRITSTGEIKQYGFTGTSDTAADDLVIGNTTGGVNRGITIWSNSSQNGSIAFADNDSNFRGAVQYIHNGDILRFLSAGNERLRIDSNGNINLGNNPTNQYGYKLNIQDNSILYAQTASSGGTELKLYLDNGNTIANFGTVTTSHLAFVTTNTERLRINSGGAVTVGTNGSQGCLQTTGIGAIRDYYDMRNIRLDGVTFDYVSNDSDGGGTSWEIKNGSVIRLYSTSGGHGGKWGREVYIRQNGYYYWRCNIRLTTTCGAIHSNTSTNHYQYPIMFRFSMHNSGAGSNCKVELNQHYATSGTCNGNQTGTGSLADGTYVTRTGNAIYLTAGTYQPRYFTNGYLGVREVHIYELALIQAGSTTTGS